MAISGPLYKLLRQIQPMLPRGGSLLEIGEANWYGDLEPHFPHFPYIAPPLSVCPHSEQPFAMAKAFYADLFAPSSIVSIDMDGTPAALKYNLNYPLPVSTSRFDVVINHGTAEHVFNIAQVFASMHDRCEVNGVMIHDAPFTPWIDHGFYCLQPTLFYDLAHANCYEVAHVSLYEIKSGWTQRVDSRDHISQIDIPNNACLFVVYRKRYETEFCVPTQGYYGGGLSAAGRKSWEVNR